MLVTIAQSRHEQIHIQSRLDGMKNPLTTISVPEVTLHDLSFDQFVDMVRAWAAANPGKQVHEPGTLSSSQ